MSHKLRVLISVCLFVSCVEVFGDSLALVIIDMQQVFIERNGHQSHGDNPEVVAAVLERQLQLIRNAKRWRFPIIVVEYGFYGQTLDSVMKAIGRYRRARVFVREWTALAAGGMFDEAGGIQNDLKRHLDDLGISDLLISGANGGACVKRSIEGALNVGYKVWVDSRAIVDFNFEQFVHPYSYQNGQTLNLVDDKRRFSFREFDDFDVISNRFGRTCDRILGFFGRLFF